MKKIVIFVISIMLLCTACANSQSVSSKTISSEESSQPSTDESLEVKNLQSKVEKLQREVERLQSELEVVRPKTESELETKAEPNTTNPKDDSIPEETPTLILVHRASCAVDICGGPNDRLLLKTFKASTGRKGWETPLGEFRIEHVSSWYWPMTNGTYARYCLRFASGPEGSFMFHTPCYARAGDPKPIPEEITALGTQASYGSVRLSVEDAEWLYNTAPDGCRVKIVDD